MNTELSYALVMFTGLIFFHVTGIIEAILWSRKGTIAFNYNEHNWLFLQRICLAILIFFPLHIILLGCLFLMFPAVHNGAYYLGRKEIDGSYKGWNAEPSKLSTANINFSWKQRAILGTVGLLGTLAFFILY